MWYFCFYSVWISVFLCLSDFVVSNNHQWKSKFCYNLRMTKIFKNPVNNIPVNLLYQLIYSCHTEEVMQFNFEASLICCWTFISCQLCSFAKLEAKSFLSFFSWTFSSFAAWSFCPLHPAFHFLCLPLDAIMLQCSTFYVQLDIIQMTSNFSKLTGHHRNQAVLSYFSLGLEESF